jgi:hypothetical protein
MLANTATICADASAGTADGGEGTATAFSIG